MSFKIANLTRACLKASASPRFTVDPTQLGYFNKTQLRNQSSLPDPTKEKVRNLAGPASLTSAAIFGLTGVGLYLYLRNEKEELAKAKRARAASENTAIGKPLIGGSFDLVDHLGKPFTEADLRGKFSIVYFGFTHCPDVCPDELDKMTEVVDNLDKDKKLISKAGNVQPIFITCDPQRDSPDVIKKYLEDFHPRFIGLTGPIEAIAKACKAYRVYFSRPPKVAPGEDYLVDHSIFFYLMDPAGKFVSCFGRDRTAEEATSMIRDSMMYYEEKKE